MEIQNAIRVPEQRLVEAAGEGMDAFIRVFIDLYWQAVGGELTAETMQRLTTPQLTLLGYTMLRDEVMDGGFVQLIHNGYGPFFFENPFARVLKNMGMKELAKMIYDVRPLYLDAREELTADCTDDEFMALFERHPEFDVFDDAFVEDEEAFTEAMARYVDEHVADFAEVVKSED